MEERREAMERAYQALRRDMVNLPERLFDHQLDVLAALTDAGDKQNVVACIPTGHGKTLPMLLSSILSPAGSCTIIVPPLVTILGQLEREARRLGIPFLNISKVSISDLRTELAKKPSLILTSIDTLAKSKVRQVLLATRLTVRPLRPLLCIDEAQIMDDNLGWTGFRPCDKEEFAWVSGALRPRIGLFSGSLMEPSLARVLGTLGISRENLKVFFMRPHRPNVYQCVKYVSSVKTRTFARNLSFLLPLAVTGKKIQIFCRKRELMNNSAAWFKKMLRMMGKEVKVAKLCGTNTNKESIMKKFGDGRVQVLFSTDVSAMGCDTPSLDIGVSIGVPSTRWKYIQQLGRVGRDEGSSAVYYTIFEKNKSIKVVKEEAEEYKTVRAMFAGQGCFKNSLFGAFTLDNPSVSYSPITEGRAGACTLCYCCSFCYLACQQCGGGQDEAKHLRHILCIEATEEIVNADVFAIAAEENELRLFEAPEEEEDGEEEDAVNGEEENEEEEDEEDVVDEDATL